MLKKLGFAAEITADPLRIAVAAKLILPGVGAFDAGMDNLERSGLIPLLNERVLEARTPVLGICLGMQLMSRSSAEGKRPGLGWMDAEALRFQPADPALKVPHMGWNLVAPAREGALIQDLPVEPRFYFVHSYYIRCHRPEDVLLTTSYGDVFHSGFHRENVWGVQFHPEKSHKFGMGLLRNFAERC
jgi:glutamine amidotransferase